MLVFRVRKRIAHIVISISLVRTTAVNLLTTNILVADEERVKVNGVRKSETKSFFNREFCFRKITSLRVAPFVHGMPVRVFNGEKKRGKNPSTLFVCNGFRGPLITPGESGDNNCTQHSRAAGRGYTRGYANPSSRGRHEGVTI